MEGPKNVEQQDTADDTPVIVINPPPQPGQGPKCIWDNGPTQRTGMCWTCIICGSTSSC